MFTGLIEEVGVVERIEEQSNGRRLQIRASHIMHELKVDDSISINGVCLTVVAADKDGFAVQAVTETLRKTTVGEWRTGTRVNLERALRADSRLGGHFVQGHVDTVAQVSNVESRTNEWLLSIVIPAQFAKFVILHGSIALDGVSLTVARWQSPIATVSLIPHTLNKTTLGDRRAGDRINLEVDLLGKYLESLFAKPGAAADLTEDKLKTMGYVFGERNRTFHE
jgi:riboflavin synthase